MANEADLVALREGLVLSSGSILKFDRYPRSSEDFGVSSELRRSHTDAEWLNYRHVAGYPIYGVGQVNVGAIKSLLEHLGARVDDGAAPPRRIEWMCMREEPVLYINGRPFTLRERRMHTRNLSYQGINTQRLEDMEMRLKLDVIAEAQRHPDGKVLVHFEDAGGEVCARWERIICHDKGDVNCSVLTLRELYHRLQAGEPVASEQEADEAYWDADEGLERDEAALQSGATEAVKYNVVLSRIPVKGQEAPLDEHFDAFTAVIGRARGAGSTLLFNCQSGRGRTTLGLVIGLMAYSLEMCDSGASTSLDLTEYFNTDGLYTDKSSAVRARFLRGEYPAVLDLMRVLPNGKRSKAIVDACVDRCNDMFNLRGALLPLMQSVLQNTDVEQPKKKSSLRSKSNTALVLRSHTPGGVDDEKDAVRRFLKSLHRYISLIVFAEYVTSIGCRVICASCNTPSNLFVDWKTDRPEISHISSKIGLALAAQLLQESSGEFLQDSEHSSSDDEVVVLSRNGSVLCRGTLLKSDHFPGCHRESLPLKIEGAPNYRQVDGFPVHGVGQATSTGYRLVLDRIGAKERPVLWMSMREEPVVLINGRPFVLRDVDAPFRNVDYTGISSKSVELIEDRLKRDIMEEAKKFDGRILLHDESSEGIITAWEEVTWDTVLTLKEMYQQLNSEGYDVTYHRIPITDEEAPEAKDVDQLVSFVLQESKKHSGKDVQLVFNCQMGRGRTTTSMIIGCLICPFIMMEKEFFIPLKADVEDASTADSEKVHLENGHYRFVSNVRGVLSSGTASKQQLDSVIDLCSLIQNLRTAVYGYKCMYRDSPKKRHFARERFENYLNRYVFLLLFSEFVDVHASSPLRLPFTEWLRQRPEIEALRSRVKLSWDRLRSPEQRQGLWRGGRNSVLCDGMLLKVGLYDRPARSPLEHLSVDPDQSAEGEYSSDSDDEFDVDNGAADADQAKFNFHRFSESLQLRTVRNYPVHGCGQPSLDGMRSILDHLGAKKGLCVLHLHDSPVLADLLRGARSVEWIALREEPSIFINGVSYVLREHSSWWRNLTYTGIAPERLSSIERALKRDVIRCARKTGKITVYGETTHEKQGDRSLVPHQHEVGAGSVMTLEEVYEILHAEGYRVRFHRMPMGSLQAPSPSTLDTMMHMIEGAPKNRDFVFNCQLGKGRTITMMSCAVLLYHRFHALPLRPYAAIPRNLWTIGMDDTPAVAQFKSEFSAVVEAGRVLSNPTDAKRIADSAVDMCSSMLSNLRTALCQSSERAGKWLRQSMEGVHTEASRSLLVRSQHHLWRYFQLMAFGDYLLEAKPESSEEFESFSDWWDQRKELNDIAAAIKTGKVLYE